MFEPKHKKDRDYNGLTTLQDFWKMVSENFEDLVFGVSGWSKRHIEASVLDHADGSVTKAKLSKEIRDILENINVDSYTKEQVDELFSKLGDTVTVINAGSDIKSVDKQGIYTDGNSYLIVVGNVNGGAKYYFDKTGLSVQSMKDKEYSDWIPVQLSSDSSLTTENKTVIGAINELVLKSSIYVKDLQYKMKQEEQDKQIEKKMEETILYSGMAYAPEWTNQPTYTGAFDSSFNVNDFYYVTLKDADGNALPSGQFMLKSSFDDTATVYSSVFTLENLNTGLTTLTENYPVEFFEIGASHRMGDAGVSAIIQDIDAWNISNGTGSIRIVVQGEVIPMSTNLYHYSHFKTDENVKFYHSTNATSAFQGESTKDIVAYTNFPELNNVGNMLFDDTVLKKDGDRYFSVERKVVVRYNEKYKNSKVYQIYGFGKALSDDINITSVALRMNSDKNGVFRNGTKIIVSEVK